MPARDVHQHCEITPQRALRRLARAAIGESVRPANLGLGCNYGGSGQGCISRNRNCPSGSDDATIALSVRTPYIASESDTSLQSVHTAGKPGPFDCAGLRLTLPSKRST